MAEYIGEQIAALIVERLEYLTAERAGYDTLLSSVFRTSTYEEASHNHLDTEVLLQFPVNENEDLSSAGNPPIIAWDQDYLIYVHLAPSETDATTFDTLVTRIARDVYRALLQDPDNAGVYEDVFGGLAAGSRLIPPDIDDGEFSGTSGLTLGIRVTFQMLETNISTSPGA